MNLSRRISAPLAACLLLGACTSASTVGAEGEVTKAAGAKQGAPDPVRAPPSSEAPALLTFAPLVACTEMACAPGDCCNSCEAEWHPSGAPGGALRFVEGVEPLPTCEVDGCGELGAGCDRLLVTVTRDGDELLVHQWVRERG